MERKKKRRTRVAKKRQRRSGAGRPRKLSSVSVAELQAELHHRRSELQSRRDELAQELQAIDQQLSQYGEASVRRGPGRPPRSAGAAPARSTGNGRRTRTGRGGNKLSLVDTLRNILNGRTMSVTDATEAVLKTGYRSKSSNFRTIVNQALILNPDKFKNVARGQYTAK